MWQGWSCRLVYCPGRNATEPIWRALTSSDGISSWTPLKPQHSKSNPNPNPLANVYWLPYSSDTSHHPSQTPWLPWISYASQKLMLASCKMVEKPSEAFHTFLWHFFHVLNRMLLHIVLLKRNKEDVKERKKERKKEDEKDRKKESGCKRKRKKERRCKR